MTNELCTICGLKPRRISSTEFCGVECFRASRRITKKCEICDDVFVVLKCFSHRKTCGKSRCISLSNPASRKDDSKWKMISCALCKNEFEIRIKRLEKGENKFCSEACFYKFQQTIRLSFVKKEHSGDYVSNKSGVKHYESSWELRRMKELDYDESVVLWDRSKLRIPWTDAKGVERKYNPDFEITYKTGDKILEEVKGYLNDDAQRKIDAGKAYAEAHGLIFRTILSASELECVEPALESYENDFGVVHRPMNESIFMSVANSFSGRSTCLRRQVGAVVTDADMTKIISFGYNGSEKDGKNQCDSLSEGNCNCIHAEINAIAKSDCSLKGTSLFTTLAPCLACSKLIINSGISRVFYLNPYRSSVGVKLLRERNVETTSYNDFCDFADRKMAESLLK